MCAPLSVSPLAGTTHRIRRLSRLITLSLAAWKEYLLVPKHSTCCMLFCPFIKKKQQEFLFSSLWRDSKLIYDQIVLGPSQPVYFYITPPCLTYDLLIDLVFASFIITSHRGCPFVSALVYIKKCIYIFQTTLFSFLYFV